VPGDARVVRRIEIADAETELALLLPFRPDDKILRWAGEFKL
jgi:hypothetical protein